ncbi:hypothetical protein [Streptomyces sp. NPDC051738]|uniref:hypothetical protein n=1 Tax=Streptomyces sp. NPDC051738 TaxID=3365672 RepID=UPI0037D06BED
MRCRLELQGSSDCGDLAAVRARIRELLDVGPFAQYGYGDYADARAYADQGRQMDSAMYGLTGSGLAADEIVLVR